MARGGARPGAGRKKKADEIAVIEKMDAVAAPELAFKNLWLKVEEGDVSAIKLWLSYRFGMPKQSVDVTSDGEKINVPVSTWVESN